MEVGLTEVGPTGHDARTEEEAVSRLVRMDQTGHTTLAEWTASDDAAFAAATTAFKQELQRGYFGMVSTGEGRAEQVRALPLDADLVILRLPIAGG